jgi:hypothetical protein
MKSAIFWNMKSRRSVQRRFGETDCPHLQGRRYTKKESSKNFVKLYPICDFINSYILKFLKLLNDGGNLIINKQEANRISSTLKTEAVSAL